MNKNLTVIDERELLGKEFRIYGTWENPLFLARDVAEWIEHSAVHMMMKNIDEDEKVRNIVSTLGGNQEMWFLTEDGLYEVLMQSRKPIAKAFKKEVKAILKQIRRTGAYQNKPMSPMELLQLQYDVLKEHDKRLEEVDEKINAITNSMTIDHGQQEVINRIAKERLVQVLGGKDTPAYRELSKKVFSNFWKTYRLAFHVGSYKDTAKKNYEEAIKYIKSWEPSKEIGYMITGANSQLQFND
ncbi:ORF6C domain-containing protein [uncultured Clostridium sp.]|uniref:ORF6C domain-containing protein n=1 Tax=uncultured Clostridium sp. TaxID=59620 RepID=UPI00261B3D09|nr:ORF6C domain-containing protein [uncultured Clostridium sp.]